MASPDPRLVAAIRREAPPNLRTLLLATSLVESGGRLDATGDAGASEGPYQENIRGRGYGLTTAQRRDPVASTRRAAREFDAMFREGYRGPELAFRAQRPANHAAYVRKLTELIPEARRLLGAGGPAPARAGDIPVDTSGGEAVGVGLDERAMRQLSSYLNRTSEQVMTGRDPEEPNRIVEMLASLHPEEAQVVPDIRIEGPGRAPGTTRGGLVPILPTPVGQSSYGYPDPEGQGGKHLAQDWFAQAGTPFAAPTGGRIVRVTPDPHPGRRATGQVFGGTLALREPTGRLFVIRHGVPRVRVGQVVRAGDVLGTVKDWSGRPHIHLEAYRPGASDREYRPQLALNPYELFA